MTPADPEDRHPGYARYDPHVERSPIRHITDEPVHTKSIPTTSPYVMPERGSSMAFRDRARPRRFRGTASTAAVVFAITMLIFSAATLGFVLALVTRR